SASFGLSRFVYFREVLFKFSLPYIFTGLKIGIGMAWICVIAAEMIGAQSGLGYFIQINRLYLRTDYMIVGMILIGLIGYFLNLSISALEKKIIKWQV
ncbi:MAG: ABC transporter permease subunit, partial [Candidatus Magasanikbacteria bacterium]|nr:ABC transporter permease subunit [Candidatus Magasanikbacteria bacterium]